MKTFPRGNKTISSREPTKEKIKDAIERGASEEEVVATVLEGERFPAKYGRTGFRRNVPFAAERLGRRYESKQVEAYAV